MNNYYNENAKDFFEGTAYVDMSHQYKDFLASIPKGGKILDVGCGSGRDSRLFKSDGYEVVAIDGSVELCKLASKHIEQDVIHMQFQEIDFPPIFDGVWACASLLHVPSYELKEVLKRIKNSLKPEGIMYTSFKYGDFEGERGGRYFVDMKEDTATQLYTAVELKIEKMWITSDARPDRVDEKWINILAKTSKG